MQATTLPRSLGKMKGAAFREFVHWYREGYGAGALRAAIGRMPRPAQCDLDVERDDAGIIASSWYDAETVHALLDAITGSLTRAQRDALVRAGGRATIERTLTGVYKVAFASMATPDRYARYAQQLWRAYSTSGVTFVRVRGARHHEALLRDWTAHHPVLCDLNIAAGERLYELMGCRKVRIVQSGCVSRGHRHCIGDTTWED